MKTKTEIEKEVKRLMEYKKTVLTCPNCEMEAYLNARIGQLMWVLS